MAPGEHVTSRSPACRLTEDEKTEWILACGFSPRTRRAPALRRVIGMV